MKTANFGYLKISFFFLKPPKFKNPPENLPFFFLSFIVSMELQKKKKKKFKKAASIKNQGLNPGVGGDGRGQGSAEWEAGNKGPPLAAAGGRNKGGNVLSSGVRWRVETVGANAASKHFITSRE